VTARAEREDLAFRLIRDGSGITLAPKSLVPKDLAAVTVSGLTVARTVGLQWRENLDPLLLANLTDAADKAALPMSAPPGKNTRVKKKK
jgi:DNA-binding transcriptional LysR family regulator